MGIIKIYKRFLSLLDVKDDSFIGKNKFILFVNEALNKLELLPNEAGQSFVDINQVGIGLAVSVNQPISLVGGTYVLANATDSTKVAIGIVVNIVDDDNIRYQASGEYIYSGGGLTKGNAYYLDVTDGLVVAVEPNNFKQILFQAIEVNLVLITIEPMFVVDASGGGSGTTIIAVNQIGIGLAVSLDEPISLTGGTYVLANGTDSTKVAIGIVTKIVDDDNIEYQDSGEYDSSGTYTQGSAYYLGITNGAVTETEPDNFKQVLFTAIEANKLLIDVGNMYVVTAGSGSGAEIIIAVNQVGLGILASLDKALSLVGSSYVLANATDSTKVAIGIATKIVDDDNIEFKDTGTYDTANAYIKGDAYYLHTTDGNSINTEPDNFKQPIFNAIETNKVLINIHPMFVVGGVDSVEEAPIDGNQYGRQDEAWTEIYGGGNSNSGTSIGLWEWRGVNQVGDPNAGEFFDVNGEFAFKVHKTDANGNDNSEFLEMYRYNDWFGFLDIHDFSERLYYRVLSVSLTGDIYKITFNPSGIIQITVASVVGQNYILGGFFVGHVAPYSHFTVSTPQDHGGVAGTVVYVNWDGTEIHKDFGFTHSTSVNPSRIQVDVDGRYEIKCIIGIALGGDGRTTFMTHYRINGTAVVIRGRQRNYSRGDTYGDSSVGLNTEIDLVSGDYIEIATTIDETDTPLVSNSIVLETEIIIRKVD